jgi:tRNA(His) 5'-end guanylyltransferase
MSARHLIDQKALDLMEAANEFRAVANQTIRESDYSRKLAYTEVEEINQMLDSATDLLAEALKVSYDSARRLIEERCNETYPPDE